MQPTHDDLRVRATELEDPQSYETRRSDALVTMARYKAARRLVLADDIGLLFEDRRTLKHQVQEMLRLESDSAEHIFRHYEDLQPAPRTLVATLFIEVRDHKAIKARLSHYAHLERHIAIDVDGGRYPATPVGAHGDDQAATAVTYLRFGLPALAWEHLHEAKVMLDHPQVHVTRPLPAAVAADPHGIRR